MNQRPKRGEVQPLSRDAARCYPSKPTAACYGCARHRFGDPEPTEVRREPIIDASRFLIGGKCLMRAIEVRSAKPLLERATPLERAWRVPA